MNGPQKEGQALATYREIGWQNIGATGSLPMTQVPELVRSCFRRGWMFLSVMAHGREIGHIESSLSRSRRWWVEEQG